MAIWSAQPGTRVAAAVCGGLQVVEVSTGGGNKDLGPGSLVVLGTGELLHMETERLAGGEPLYLPTINYTLFLIVARLQ